VEPPARSEIPSDEASGVGAMTDPQPVDGPDLIPGSGSQGRGGSEGSGGSEGTGGTAAGSDSGAKSSNAWARTALEWGGLIIAALVIAILIKTFLFQAFYIPSDSMVPTLKQNDRVIVNKLSYKMHDVHRDDIVVFKAPPGTEKDVKDLVKRVIGLPGETVEGKNDHVFINGKLLVEPYLPAGTITSDFPKQTVPPNSFWVMGDNREFSRDSRYFKFIPKKDIVGRVFLRIWPLNRLGLL
jgi:signal peptidase I